MTSIIPVEPTQSSLIITSVRINIYQLVLNVGFRCVCYLLDSSGNQVETRDLTIEGDEYNSWSNDDEMIQLILNKLGLNKHENPNN